MSDKEFVPGLFFKPPHQNAPDYVRCAVAIDRKKLGNWLRGKEDDWVNLDVKVSRDGKWYAQVNNWKPQSQQQQPAQPKDFEDDIPFR